MNKRLTLLIGIPVIVAAGGYWYWNTTARPSVAVKEEPGSSATAIPGSTAQPTQKAPSQGFDASEPIVETGIFQGKPYTNQITDYKVLAQTPSQVLVSYEQVRDDEVTVVLLVNKNTRTGISIGAAYHEPTGGYGVLYSEDRKHLLVPTEQKLVLVDMTTLSYKTIYTPDAETTYGTYTALPSFIPQVHWLTNNSVQISIYPASTPNNNDGKPPSPKEVRTISIAE